MAVEERVLEQQCAPSKSAATRHQCPSEEAPPFKPSAARTAAGDSSRVTGPRGTGLQQCRDLIDQCMPDRLEPCGIHREGRLPAALFGCGYAMASSCDEEVPISKTGFMDDQRL